MLKIAHLSDFHVRPDYSNTCMEKIKTMRSYIASEDIEIIVYTGDIIDYKYVSEKLKDKDKSDIKLRNDLIKECYNQALMLFKELTNIISVKRIIICPGNHDLIRSEKKECSMTEECDESGEEYIESYKFYNYFTKSLINKDNAHITRVEEYSKDGEKYYFLVSNTNWFRNNNESKSTKDCINCKTVSSFIKKIASKSNKTNNIFISHLPTDFICECAKYSYGSNLNVEIDKNFRLCLAGDKHDLSTSKNSYIVGNPLYDEYTTIGIHILEKDNHIFNSVKIYNDTYKIIADQETTKKAFEICKNFLSNRSTNLLFNNKENIQIDDVINYFSTFENEHLKLIEKMYDKVIRLKERSSSSNRFIEVEKDFSFNYIAKLIEQDDNDKNNIINFKGEHESGKSTMISILYMYLLYQHLYNSYKYFPVYFNIEYYRNLGYNSKTILKELKKIIKIFIEFSTEISKPICLFIDGLNQYCLFGDDPDLGVKINDELRALIEAHNDYTIVLSIDIFDHPLDAHKSIFDSSEVWKNSNFLMYFNAIRTIPQYEKTFIEILKYVTKLKNEDETQITKIVNKIYDESILSVHLMFLFEYNRSFLQDASNIMHTINSNRLSILANNKDKKSIATKTAVGIFYEKKTFHDIKGGVNISEKEYTQMFEYIENHKFFSNYLIAKEYVEEIKNISKQLIKKGKVEINPLINAMLPQPILYFIRQEFAIHDGQIDILNCLNEIKRRKINKIDYMGIANLIYLAGRGIGLENATILDEIEKKYCDNKCSNNTELFKQMVLQRTVTISKIYVNNSVESSKILNEYINQLMKNQELRNVNRVFYRMFYQDAYALMDINEYYVDDGDSESFDFYYTYHTLVNRIRNGYENRNKNKIVEVDLFTLCDLIITRIKIDKTNDDKQTFFYQTEKYDRIKTIMDTTIDIINQYFNNNDFPCANNSLFVGFLKNAIRDFKMFPIYLEKYTNRPFFHQSMIINQLDLIKFQERQGWLIRDKHDNHSLSMDDFNSQKQLASIETVVEHIYMTYLIGLFYLPNKIKEYEEYNKQTVLNIILIHDIGESFVGDCSPYLKNFDSMKNDEDKFNRELFSSWIYLDNVDLSEQMHYWDLWKNADNHGDINYRIAKQLDKVQLLYEFSKIKDKAERFTAQRIKDLESIKDSITIPYVKQILEKIVYDNQNVTLKEFFESLKKESIDNDE